MKKIIIISIGLLFSLTTLFSQNVGYVNTETILAQIPEYVSSKGELDKLSKQYMFLLEGETAKIEAAYRAYQADRSGLSELQKQARERDIIEMERLTKDKQKAYFGEDGVMAKKSQELLNPIKKRVEEAVARVAAEKGCSIILDLSALQGVVYNDPKADLSLEVIKKLK